jgi:hypothetical protein
MAWRVKVGFAMLALLAMCLLPLGAAADAPIVIPNPTHPDASYDVKKPQPAAPMPAWMIELQARKAAAARKHMQDRQNSKPGSATPNAYSNGLAQNQQAQWNSYYCGPAAVTEVLGMRGVYTDQGTMAGQLGTTTDGTAWYDGYRYPVADVLNNNFGGNYYAAVAVAYNPTSSDYSNYNSYLVYDIDHGWGIAGDAWEEAGGAHLVGHPVNQTIFHWFAIRGYSDYGNTTSYEDSVAGSVIGWPVPPYSDLASSTIVAILGGRGYVW